MVWKGLHWFEKIYICLKRTTLVWKGLHWYEKDYICLKRTTLVWKGIHWFEKDYTGLKRTTLIWKELKYGQNHIFWQFWDENQDKLAHFRIKNSKKGMFLQIGAKFADTFHFSEHYTHERSFKFDTNIWLKIFCAHAYHCLYLLSFCTINWLFISPSNLTLRFLSVPSPCWAGKLKRLFYRVKSGTEICII